MTYGYVLSAHIPALPQVVFDTWMSSEGHSAMTGGDAVVDPSIGGAFTAWDGYIWGETLEIEPGQRVWCKAGARRTSRMRTRIRRLTCSLRPVSTARS